MNKKERYFYDHIDDIHLTLQYRSDLTCEECKRKGGWIDRDEHTNPIALCNDHLQEEIDRGYYEEFNENWDPIKR